jgi:hypothetical protein
MVDVLYRYEGVTKMPPVDAFGDINPIPLEHRQCWLRLDEYPIVGRTPKAYRILLKDGTIRIVRNTTSKQFAWETKEQALDSYIRRKERQIIILEAQKIQSERYLQLARKLHTPTYVIEKPWWESEV